MKNACFNDIITYKCINQIYCIQYSDLFFNNTYRIYHENEILYLADRRLSIKSERKIEQLFVINGKI